MVKHKVIVIPKVETAKLIVALIKGIKRSTVRDTVAVLVLITGLTLTAFGIDGLVSAVTIATAGYYFGRREMNSQKR